MNSQKTVIMADDDADDCFMATEAFGDAGAKAAFSCVTDGIELLDRLQEGSRPEGRGLPDLILLDLNMPRKNGIDTLNEIRSDPVLKRIPVVVLTTSSEGKVAPGVLSLADAYFTKPPSFDEWITMMKWLAGRWLA